MQPHAPTLRPLGDLRAMAREIPSRLRPRLEGPLTAGLDVLTFGLVGWVLLICV